MESAFYIYKKNTHMGMFLIDDGDQYGIRTRECRLERAMC